MVNYTLLTELRLPYHYGADVVQIARGLMIAVGCIGAQKCHSNECPVGVATTNPKLQKALVVDEKRYRVTNYMTTLREELYMLAAAAGIHHQDNSMSNTSFM